MRLRAYAKINLGLEVTGKQADGYHTLKTILQTIDLHDEIDIRENSGGRIHLRGNDPHIAWDESNTIYRAIRLMAKRFQLPRGFDIQVRKQIPPGSGLGGGSSNAGVILLFLREHFRLDLPLGELIQMAAAVGADVPFFLLGGTAMAEGIGERLRPLADGPSQKLALVIPELPVPTKLVFSRHALTKGRQTSKIDFFLKNRDYRVLDNHLEKTTFALFPGLKAIKEKMKQGGCRFVRMSGTGSALFGQVAPEFARRLHALLPELVFVKTMSRKLYQESIGVWPSGKASAFGAEIRRFESSRPSNL